MVINMSTRSTMSTILGGHANGDCTHSNDSTHPTVITVVVFANNANKTLGNITQKVTFFDFLKQCRQINGHILAIGTQI